MNTENALQIISDDLLMKFHENDWDKNTYTPYSIQGYKHSNVFSSDIIIKLFPTKFVVHFYIKNFTSRHKCITGKSFKINDEDDIGSKIKEILNFIYTFNDEYEYSKILDKFLFKSNKVKEEELVQAIAILRHEKIEECSVCYDPNIVKTSCGHNLCRFCTVQIFKQYPHCRCPICRKCLKCRSVQEEHDDEEA